MGNRHPHMRATTDSNASLCLAATIVLMVIIAVLSLVPGNPQPGDSEIVWMVSRVPPSLQNTMHVVLYACLALMWFWWLAATGRDTLPAKLSILIGIIVFGMGLESLQLMVPGRYASLTDAGLNAIGASTGAAISWFAQRNSGTTSAG